MELAEPLIIEMGKEPFQVRLASLFARDTRNNPNDFPLEISTTMTIFSQVNEHMKRCMNRAVHVRFWRNAGVKFPRLTRLAVNLF
jgi:hypothetical protein